jgi:LPXTG-motif cell wall-anchored protein
LLVGATVALAVLLSMTAGVAAAATAPWSAPVPVVDGHDAAVASVVAPDGTITIVFGEYSAVGIQTATSTDSGATWGSAAAVGSGGDYAYRPTIASSSSGLLAVTWVEDVAGSQAIYVATSADQGSTWSAAIALPTISTSVDSPVIASSNSNGFTVVWKEDFDKVASSSADGGLTWSPASVLSQNLNSYGDASVVPTGIDNVVAIFIEFNGNDNEYSIQSARSADGGVTWAAKVAVTPAWSGGLGNGRYVIGVSPSTDSVVAFWTHGLPGFTDGLFAATSSNGGASWGSTIQVVGPVDELSEFRVQVVSPTTAGVLWYHWAGPSSAIAYSTVAVGAASASAPVVINPDGSAYYDRLPSLATFGDIRVATWLQLGDSPALSGYYVSASCDAGATWNAPAELAIGADVNDSNALALASGGVFTTYWGSYDVGIDDDTISASSTDVPCTQTAVATLANTGSSDVLPTALVAVAMLVLGAGFVFVRRAKSV